jgi:hypothetical protein
MTVWSPTHTLAQEDTKFSVEDPSDFLLGTMICGPLACSNLPREVVFAVSRTLGFNASLKADSGTEPDNLSKAWGKIFALRSGIATLVSLTKGHFYRLIVTGNWMRRVLGSFSDFRTTSTSEEKLVADRPGKELVDFPGKEVTSELAPEDASVGQFSGPMPLDLGSRAALYDIEAHTVYMPNGERLEAHSGIGRRKDDPRYVHDRNRGATPPHIYDLGLRRRLFHGVVALRLQPVGDGNMFGRAGMLAHSYMLGPRGDSHGCVVFKDYPRFLQAFRSGEVVRLVVVRHLGDANSASVRNRPVSILEIEPALATAAKTGRTKDSRKAAKQPDAGANSL